MRIFSRKVAVSLKIIPNGCFVEAIAGEGAGLSNGMKVQEIFIGSDLLRVFVLTFF